LAALVKNVTLKDIADRLGVSVATVSLALNGRPTVNAETRQRVLECIREMEYTPHPLARSR
jgi:LacI family transcriptional regulator